MRRQLEQARAQRDVVKTLCLNDKLSQIDVASRSAPRPAAAFSRRFSGTTSSWPTTSSPSSRVLRQRAEQLSAEANQCIGEEIAFVGQTQVTTQIDPNLPGEDTTEPPTEPIGHLPRRRRKSRPHTDCALGAVAAATRAQTGTRNSIVFLGSSSVHRVPSRPRPMTKIGLAAPAALVALLAPSTVFAQAQYVAQGDTPQWLKDRRYNEGIGIREGDVELASRGRRRSWLRLELVLSLGQERVRQQRPGHPAHSGARLPHHALVLPFDAEPPAARGHGPGRTAAHQVSDGRQRNVPRVHRGLQQPRGIPTPEQHLAAAKHRRSADARLDIAPERPLGAALYANYARIIMPTSVASDPNLSFNRDDVGAGAEIVTQPGWRHARLALRLHIPRHDLRAGGGPALRQHHPRALHTRPLEVPAPHGAGLRRLVPLHQLHERGRALAQEGLVNSTPVSRAHRAQWAHHRLLCLAGLSVGWGASFYQNTISTYNRSTTASSGRPSSSGSCSASPAQPVGRTSAWPFRPSPLAIIATFKTASSATTTVMDRGYLRFNYFFAGRALLTLEGGAGAIEYPTMYWGQTGDSPAYRRSTTCAWTGRCSANTASPTPSR